MILGWQDYARSQTVFVLLTIVSIAYNILDENGTIYWVAATSLWCVFLVFVSVCKPDLANNVTPFFIFFFKFYLSCFVFCRSISMGIHSMWNDARVWLGTFGRRWGAARGQGDLRVGGARDAGAATRRGRRARRLARTTVHWPNVAVALARTLY